MLSNALSMMSTTKAKITEATKTTLVEPINCSNELVHKVTWPSLEQLIGSTKVVLVASVIFALVVLAMDMAFENIMNGVYNLLR